VRPSSASRVNSLTLPLPLPLASDGFAGTSLWFLPAPRGLYRDKSMTVSSLSDPAKI
jgi:hypothetical protein